MLTHSGLWSAICQVAKKNDMTPSGLARFCGLDPTAFNKCKRFSAFGQPHWPSTGTIAKILNATGMTIHEFAAMFPQDQEVVPQDK